MKLGDPVALRVVLVDDSAESRQLLRAMLDLVAGIEIVGVASDGRQAVDVLRDVRADVVFLDIAMPVMDGLEAATVLRAMFPGLKIIVNSGYDRTAMGLAALSAGADEYFEKAANLEQLATQLRVAFPGRELSLKSPSADPASMPARSNPGPGVATAQEHRHRLLLDALQEGILVTDSLGVITEANLVAAQAILQLPLGRVVGRTLREVGLDATGVIADRMRSGRPLRDLDCALARPDGTARALSLAALPLGDMPGSPPGAFVVSIIDMTGRRDGQQFLRQLLETTLEGVWAFDTENATTYVNSRVASMAGRQVEGMVGIPIWDFISERSRPDAESSMLGRRAGVCDVRELWLRREDGSEFPVLASTSPTHDADGCYVGGLAMFTDISHRKRVEEALTGAFEDRHPLSGHTRTPHGSP